MLSIICRLIPRHLENLLVHGLLQLSSIVPRSPPLRLTSRCLHGPSHAASGLAVLAVRAVEHPLSFYRVHSLHVEVVDIMSSAVISLWVCGFLGVLQALLMIVFSSIIVFLCASLGPGAFCCVCNITRPAYIVILLFTIAISTERCQSTRRLNIGSVFLFECSATARHTGVSNITV